MRQRLALLAMLFLPPDPGTLLAFARSTSTSVVWITPTAKTTYASGDTITGKWNTSKALVSPSVSLCLVDSGSSGGTKRSAGETCGKALWPNIANDGNQYSFSLAAPDVDNSTSTSNEFYLKLKDDFGHEEKSPKFTVKTSGVKSSTLSDEEFTGPESGAPASASDATSAEPSNGPVSAEAGAQSSESVSGTPNAIAVQAGSGSSAAGPPKAASTKVHGKAGVPPDATAQAGFMTSVAGSTGTAGSGTTITTISVQSLAPGQLSTNNHAQISAVAVAVPLSLVAVTLLASVLMCYVHQRSMASQRQKNVDLLATSGNMAHQSSVDPHAGPSDVEKAIDALYAYEQAPLPSQSRAIYAPMQVKHPIPRTDARRDRLYMPYNSRSSTPGTCVDDHRLSQSDYHQPYSYSGVPSDGKRRFVVENTYDLDDSATEAVLSEYLSTPSHMYRSESSTSGSLASGGNLRHPPRLHSRCSMPEPTPYGYQRGGEKDIYEAVSRAVSQTRSNYSYSSLRY